MGAGPRNLAHGNKLSNHPSNKEGMVSLGANANLKKPNPKSGRKTMAGGRFSNGGLSNPAGTSYRHSSGRRSSFALWSPVKPAETSRMPVTQWIARCWIQPIGKP